MRQARMGEVKSRQIRKRDGSVVSFQSGKIERAVHSALVVIEAGHIADLTAEPILYLTVNSEYAGGCHSGICPFQQVQARLLLTSPSVATSS